MTEDFSTRLKTARSAAGLKAKELAVLSGISASYLSELESGKRQNPANHLVEKFATRCGVSVDWLLGRSDNPAASLRPPDGPRPMGPIQQIGSGSSREVLEYRAVSADWLQSEIAAMGELLPTAPDGRGRLSIIRRMLEMLVELQERCLDSMTGRQRSAPATPPATADFDAATVAETK